MDTLVNILLVFHLLAMAFVFGGAIYGLTQKRAPKALLHGALTALVVGLVMVLVREFQDGVTVNHMKIGIKLIVNLAVCFFAWRVDRRKDFAGARTDLIAVAGLTAANVAIAVLVH